VSFSSYVELKMKGEIGPINASMGNIYPTDNSSQVNAGLLLLLNVQKVQYYVPVI
jgi:hypothetical protein